MKKTKLFTFVLAIAATMLQVSMLVAQDDKSKRPSPPAQAKATVGKATIVIDYSQPSVKGREIGVELAPYGKVWRTGANEATTFEVGADVKVEGKPLKAGKYGLFTIPGEKEWVIIFNSVPDQWGSRNYDQSKDVLRVTVKASKKSDSVEKFTINIESNGKAEMKWGTHLVKFKVSG